MVASLHYMRLFLTALLLTPAPLSKGLDRSRRRHQHHRRIRQIQLPVATSASYGFKVLSAGPRSFLRTYWEMRISRLQHKCGRSAESILSINSRRSSERISLLGPKPIASGDPSGRSCEKRDGFCHRNVLRLAPTELVSLLPLAHHTVTNENLRLFHPRLFS